MEKGVSNKAVKTMKLLAIILVVLLLVIIAAAQFGGVTFSTIGDSIRTSLAGIGSGEGYPYSINGVEISGAGMTNSDLVLVYDDTVKVLDSTAKELSIYYVNPTSKNRTNKVKIYVDILTFVYYNV